jgi:hypothetical protein
MDLLRKITIGGHCDGLGLVQAESRELDKIDRVVADMVGLSIVK